MKEEEVVKVVTCLSVLPQGYKFVHQAMCNELQQWAMLTKKDGRAQRYHGLQMGQSVCTPYPLQLAESLITWWV